MKMTKNKKCIGYKIRLYPTKEQEAMFFKHINCCRYIWNYMLELQNKAYEVEKRHIGLFDMIRMLYHLKNENKWLREVSSTSLRTVCRDLDKTFDAYFEKICRHPKFKSKHKSKLSFPTRADHFYISETTINVEKIGRVRYKTDRNLHMDNTLKFYNPRIIYTNNKWILTVSAEYESQVLQNPTGRVGIDLGIKNLATISYFYNDCNGNDCGYYKNINRDKYMKRLERKSIHYQRVMSRKLRVNNCYKVECEDGKYRRYDSNNYKKVRQLHQRVEARIANIRLNYIHHITKDIINLNPEVITMEDLKVKNMLKNPKLAPHISKACWRKFRDIMAYKAAMHGIQVQIAPWWFPSSKNCSCCGHKKRKLGLDERVYRCNECGLEIDRDLNAAINLQWFNYDRT